MSSGSLEKGYEPKNVEKRWYEYWEKEGLFSAGEKEGAKNYSKRGKNHILRSYGMENIS